MGETMRSNMWTRICVRSCSASRLKMSVVLRQVLVRTKLTKNEMTLCYVAPPIERSKSVIAPVPPWELDSRFCEGPFICRCLQQCT